MSPPPFTGGGGSWRPLVLSGMHGYQVVSGTSSHVRQLHDFGFGQIVSMTERALENRQLCLVPIVADQHTIAQFAANQMVLAAIDPSLPMQQGNIFGLQAGDSSDPSDKNESGQSSESGSATALNLSDIDSAIKKFDVLHSEVWHTLISQLGKATSFFALDPRYPTFQISESGQEAKGEVGVLISIPYRTRTGRHSKVSRTLDGRVRVARNSQTKEVIVTDFSVDTIPFKHLANKSMERAAHLHT
jgi:hypothetical protein